jgi:DNA-binding transcriptional MerR regulator
LIALGRNAGFSLDEIGMMFSPESAEIDRQALSDKADQLDRTIRQLAAMRDGLRHAAKCPEADHLACPTFQRLMALSLDKQRRRTAV